jgi:hypothetical protein
MLVLVLKATAAALRKRAMLLRTARVRMLWLAQTMQVLRAQVAMWVLKRAIHREPRVQPMMARMAREALVALVALVARTAKAPAAQTKTVQLPRAARARTWRAR